MCWMKSPFNPARVAMWAFGNQGIPEAPPKTTGNPLFDHCISPKSRPGPFPCPSGCGPQLEVRGRPFFFAPLVAGRLCLPAGPAGRPDGPPLGKQKSSSVTWGFFQKKPYLPPFFFYLSCFGPRSPALQCSRFTAPASIKVLRSEVFGPLPFGSLGPGAGMPWCFLG